MKKISIIIVLFMLNIYTVNATSYYTNSNGVNMSYEEMNYIDELYGDRYSKYITLDEYDILKENSLIGKNIEKKTNSNSIEINNVEHRTRSNIITITKSCSDNCIVVLDTDWLIIPKVKSWDVIGAYLDSSSVLSVGQLKLIDSNNNIKTYNNYKKTSNGVGYSAKAINSRFNVKMSMVVSKKGRIYGSYQHAKENITESQSQNYYFSYNGLGNVFAFNNGLNNKYDNTGGVWIDL